MIPSIDRDLKNKTFETVFNRNFYFEGAGLVSRKEDSRLSVHRTRPDKKIHHSIDSKENKIKRRSLPKKKSLERVQSQTLRVR